jgi:hypothetical protein
MSNSEYHTDPEQSSADTAEHKVFSTVEESGHACGDRWVDGPSRWCAVCG